MKLRITDLGKLWLLTKREREVLLNMAEGRWHKEIAQAMGISQSTVEFHVYNLHRKTGITREAQLARFAIRLGLIKA